MDEHVGLWIDAEGQYHACLVYEGATVMGIGATAVEAFAACWEVVFPLVAAHQSVSDDPRPGCEDVS